LPRLTAELSTQLITQVQEELEGAEVLCQQYADVIARKYQSPDDSGRPARLQQELTNRRQYISYLSQLDSAFKQAGSHAEQLTRMLLSEMEGLKELVGSRTSVPKEHVYPRFDSLAKLWASFDEEHMLLLARKTTLGALQAHRLSYSPTLNTDDLVAMRNFRRSGDADGERVLPAADEAAAAAALPDVGGEGQQAEQLSGDDLRAAQHTRLELEGFCPTTIVQRDGLLLPGATDLLCRYNGRVYGFVDEPSLVAFMGQPEAYVRAVLNVAKRAPELIHMLRLQEHFPAASIAEIMRQHAQHTTGTSLLAPARSYQDSNVQTPTHFVEKHIDMGYEWNEWALRRRALQLANLRQKKTTSMQTAASALRRDADTQVYLPTENGTMTGVSTGTAVPISRNYVAGLRGAPDSEMSLVNLTYDPETVIGKYR